MRLISLLNNYQHFPGFVYERARHCAASQTIEIAAPRLETGVLGLSQAGTGL
jgi:hypothetical protein